MRLEVKSGGFGYPGQKKLLEGISMVSDRHDVTAVLGPNGAGKSTFLKCLLGLLEWTMGAALLDGRDIRRIPKRQLWRGIGYVPQKKTPSSLSVAEMVLLGRTAVHGLLSQPTKEDDDAVGEAMALLEISSLREKSCSRISQGELQLVMIARALAAKPQILVMDEPESGLDISNGQMIMEVIRRLSDEEGMQVIFTTHNPQHALAAADYSLLLDKNGRSLWGETDGILTGEHLEQAYGMKLKLIQAGEYICVAPQRGRLRLGGDRFEA